MSLADDYFEGWHDGIAWAESDEREWRGSAASLEDYRSELESAKHMKPRYGRAVRAYWLGVLRGYRWNLK